MVNRSDGYNDLMRALLVHHHIWRSCQDATLNKLQTNDFHPAPMASALMPHHQPVKELRAVKALPRYRLLFAHHLAHPQQ